MLIVLLQVAMLPERGRLRCMLRMGTLSCCCATVDGGMAAAAADTPEVEQPPLHSCCQQREQMQESGQGPGAAGGSIDRPDREPCSCGDDDDPLPLAPDEADAPHAPATLAPARTTPLPRSLPDSVTAHRVGNHAVPRQATGPPRHVLLQVFLI